MGVVERFATEAAHFAAWADAGTDSGAAAARNGLVNLTRLYLCALELPASADETEGEIPDAWVDDAQWR